MNIPQLIERYAAGPDLLEQSVRGLAPAALDAHPVPGTWSIRQIVVHLMDSDVIASYRMKWIIAHDEPRILAYDQDRFVERLNYRIHDIDLACALFRANRAITAAMLRSQPLAAFERSGMHEERGRITLGDLLKIYTEHLDHHLAFIDKKRAMLGTPVNV